MIEHFLAIIVFVISTLFAWIIITGLNKGSRLLYSPPVVFFWLHLVMVQIGALCLALDYDFLSHILVIDNLAWALFLYSIQMSLGLLCFAVGCAMSSFVYKFSARKELSIFQSKNISFPLRQYYALITIILGFLFIFFMGSYYLARGGAPFVAAILNLLAGDSSSGLSAMRAENSYDNAMPGTLLQVVRVVLPYIALSLLFFNKFSPKRSFVIGVLKYPIALFATLFLVANGERMPLISIILVWLICENYLNYIKRQSKLIFLGVCVISIVLIALSLLLGREQLEGGFLDNMTLLFSNLVHRVFISQSQTGSYIYQIIQEFSDLRGFEIYKQNLLTYLPGSVNSFSADLFYIVHGRPGSASHSSLAEAYASFGFSGVLSISFILGLTFQYVTIRMVRGEKNIPRMIFYSFVTVILSLVALGSVTGVFYGGLVGLIFIFVLQRGLTLLLQKLFGTRRSLSYTRYPYSRI